MGIPPSGGRDAAECYALATLWISGAPGLFFGGTFDGGEGAVGVGFSVSVGDGEVDLFF